VLVGKPSNRCLIPASAFFEFTGKKYPKAKHRFVLKGSPITPSVETAIAATTEAPQWHEAAGPRRAPFQPRGARPSQSRDHFCRSTIAPR
jgi:hypothetical protein